jgi:hypothetical protein
MICSAVKDNFVAARKFERVAVQRNALSLCFSASFVVHRLQKDPRIEHGGKIKRRETSTGENRGEWRFSVSSVISCKTNRAADSADTRGWANHLVRIDPRVSASSAVLLHDPPD